VRVVIAIVSVMAAYAAITLTTLTSTGCGSLMMVLSEAKHVVAAFITLTILII
jgi:hypothetical protein